MRAISVEVEATFVGRQPGEGDGRVMAHGFATIIKAVNLLGTQTSTMRRRNAIKFRKVQQGVNPWLST